MADPDMSSQSGGHDVELFVETPDYDLICTICQGVLRCPVRAACHHIFCKKCILQWLKRHQTCPCCRKPVNQSLIFVMFKLSKVIGRLKIKVSKCFVREKTHTWSNLISCSKLLLTCPMGVFILNLIEPDTCASEYCIYSDSLAHKISTC